MTDNAVILSVDTATISGGVCLLRGKEVLASIPGESTLSHSSTLLRDIESALEKAGLSLSKVDVFAAAIGPGSFTGLRIGIATVKALSAVLEKPCVGVPTLHAIARAAGNSSATVSLLPAGRGELFSQLVSVSKDGEVTELDSPAHLSPQEVVTKYSELPKLIWAGTGAHAQKDLLLASAQKLSINFAENGGASEGWRLAPLELNLALQIAAMAGNQEESDLLTADHLRALYVRPSDPELKIANSG
ncbi:MAG TPA: tRNA (adenosine(37)-N6)-threonylcarbamoyltransferase complex dimerization subunit type 1 TsaB [Pyrinomonadaceae bacterium]|nr:tRNA (adenosine(37)-N6)-threonylcarbamoyltransferase complex dimerization subunit type 1 TsaB [Pyrinomonadaceae bacterium]